ncbi:hypothetical protein AVEN_206498-1 [Araneus ventricosus]|uniref:Uncharacterized protein n=1 Tax=Araneus ventricosus TaxID=182803 RepID=A0A4Y2VQ81_ARAVE|nr:hypothetical protein AVEN_206498-1 [Araneus ventricosus]
MALRSFIEPLHRNLNSAGISNGLPVYEDLWSRTTGPESDQKNEFAERKNPFFLKNSDSGLDSLYGYGLPVPIRTPRSRVNGMCFGWEGSGGLARLPACPVASGPP